MCKCKVNPNLLQLHIRKYGVYVPEWSPLSSLKGASNKASKSFADFSGYCFRPYLIEQEGALGLC